MFTLNQYRGLDSNRKIEPLIRIFRGKPSVASHFPTSNHISRFPARTISDSPEIEKQRENESSKGAHARFEVGTLKILAEIERIFPAHLLDFTPRVRRQ